MAWTLLTGSLTSADPASVSTTFQTGYFRRYSWKCPASGSYMWTSTATSGNCNLAGWVTVSTIGAHNVNNTTYPVGSAPLTQDDDSAGNGQFRCIFTATKGLTYYLYASPVDITTNPSGASFNLTVKTAVLRWTVQDASLSSTTSVPATASRTYSAGIIYRYTWTCPTSGDYKWTGSTINKNSCTWISSLSTGYNLYTDSVPYSGTLASVNNTGTSFNLSFTAVAGIKYYIYVSAEHYTDSISLSQSLKLDTNTPKWTVLTGSLSNSTAAPSSVNIKYSPGVIYSHAWTCPESGNYKITTSTVNSNCCVWVFASSLCYDLYAESVPYTGTLATVYQTGTSIDLHFSMTKGLTYYIYASAEHYTDTISLTQTLTLESEIPRWTVLTVSLSNTSGVPSTASRTYSAGIIYRYTWTCPESTEYKWTGSAISSNSCTWISTSSSCYNTYLESVPYSGVSGLLAIVSNTGTNFDLTFSATKDRTYYIYVCAERYTDSISLSQSLALDRKAQPKWTILSASLSTTTSTPATANRTYSAGVIYRYTWTCPEAGWYTWSGSALNSNSCTWISTSNTAYDLYLDAIPYIGTIPAASNTGTSFELSFIGLADKTYYIYVCAERYTDSISLSQSLKLDKLLWQVIPQLDLVSNGFSFNTILSGHTIHCYSLKVPVPGQYIISSSDCEIDTVGWISKSMTAYKLDLTANSSSYGEIAADDNGNGSGQFRLVANLENNTNYYFYYSTKYVNDLDFGSSTLIRINFSVSYTTLAQGTLIEPSTISAFKDMWEGFCSSRKYYGNIDDIVVKNSFAVPLTGTEATAEAINAAVDSYNKYFLPSISTVNTGDIIEGEMYDLLVHNIMNNPSCKVACTGFCSSTNSHKEIPIGCSTCDVSCSSSCFGICESVCVGTCSGYCYLACGAGCTTDCGGYCNESCSGRGGHAPYRGCGYYCDSLCGSTCGGGCIYDCWSCTGYCDGYCLDSCDEGCSVECSGTCSVHCDLNCTAECSGQSLANINFCSYNCIHACATSCDNFCVATSS